MPALTAAEMPSGNWTATLAACNGCGVAFAADYDVEHRPDCTVEPSPLICEVDDCDAIRLPSERGQLWQYDPNTHTYRCPTHHQKGTTR